MGCWPSLSASSYVRLGSKADIHPRCGLIVQQRLRREYKVTYGEWGLLIGLGFGVSHGFWTLERKLNQILELLTPYVPRSTVHDSPLARR
jgi:hypothetical protein